MRRSTTTVRVALLLGAVLLSACGRAALPTTAAASVNGVEIPHELFERLVSAQINDVANPLAGAEAAERIAAVADLQRQVLTQLIRNELFIQAGAEIGVEVTEADIDDRWQQEIDLRASEEDFRGRLEQLGLTEAEARDQLRAIVTQERISEQFEAEAAISEDDLVALYESRLESTYTRAAASHILVATEAEANAILDLLAGGESFETLAETQSSDEFSAAQGGSLGTNPRGTFVPAFDDAVWNGTEGEIVGPVETEFGFHIIRIDEFEVVPYEEARPALRDEVVSQTSGAAFQDFVAGVLSNADVVVAARYGVYDPVSGAVADPAAVSQLPVLPGDQPDS